MEKPTEDLIDIVEALNAAFNAHDLDALMAFFADDVVYRVGPPGALSVVSVGKQQIRDSAKGILPGLRLETWGHKVSGNIVTSEFRNSSEFYKTIGIDYVDGTTEIIFSGDKIEVFNLTYSVESVRKMWAGQEE